ncbi:hypothetical protein ACQPX6_24725 [Actinomycetospora sp. CA-101289]|uniref:hypothetical protein n=1 Tax=Actinomycetospora sp. CA-101289 TaxID=3239893 RepID=UPI003D95C431
MRKTLGAGIAGLVIVGSAAIGTGTAAAEPLPAAPQAAECSRALLPLLTGTQKRLCEATLGLTSSVGSTAGSVVQSVPRVVQSVPRAVPRVVPRVVEGVGGTVSGVTGSGRTGSAPATRAPSASSSSGRTSGTSGTSGSGAATRAPATGAAAAPAAGATSIAPTQNYDTLMSSAYDRVPTGLLGTSPVGGAGASLIAPAAFDPRLLLSGRPARTLGAPENGVTTASTADPAAYAVGRIGTPALLGVLTASSVLALFVRSVVLRRSRRPARA